MKSMGYWRGCASRGIEYVEEDDDILPKDESNETKSAQCKPINEHELAINRAADDGAPNRRKQHTYVRSGRRLSDELRNLFSPMEEHSKSLFRGTRRPPDRWGQTCNTPEIQSVRLWTRVNRTAARFEQMVIPIDDFYRWWRDENAARRVAAQIWLSKQFLLIIMMCRLILLSHFRVALVPPLTFPWPTVCGCSDWSMYRLLTRWQIS